MNINTKSHLIGWIVVAAAVIVGCGRDIPDTGQLSLRADATATAANVLLDNVLSQTTFAKPVTHTAVIPSEQTPPTAPTVGVDGTPTITQADQIATLVAATLAAIPTTTLTPTPTMTPTPDWGATQVTQSAQVETLVAATLSAVSTAMPAWTATVDALAVQVATSVAATPQPRGDNFRACLEPCAANRSNARWSMPAAVTKVHIAYDYSGISVGAHYQRIWQVVGRGEWVRYDCIWPGPSDGTVEVTLTEPNGLNSGEWEMSIVVDGVVILRESFVVAGDWNAWYPAGVFPTCFGKVSTQ